MSGGPDASGGQTSDRLGRVTPGRRRPRQADGKEALFSTSPLAPETSQLDVDCRRCGAQTGAFLPVLTLGLVISSISSSTFWLLTPGGSSFTTSCHWPRARSSIFQRARTFRLPRPVR